MELMEKQGFKHTEEGWIPEDWSIKKLTEVVEYIHGKAHEQDIDENGEYIVANSKFISTDGLVRKFSRKIHCEAKKGDVLTVLSDIPNGKALAKCFYVESDNEITVNQRICIWRSKDSHPKFNFYKLNRLPYFLAINDGVNQTNIGNSDIEKCILVMPSLKEQKAIATALSDVDELITNLDKLITKKKSIKQGAMQKLLTPPHKGGKRLEGFGGDWEEKTIGELCKTFTKQTGFDYSNHIKPTLINKKQIGHLPFIQNKDFNGHNVNFDTDYFIPTDVAIKFPMILLNEKCLMISISGSIGKVGVFNNKEMAFIGGAVSVGKFNDPRYLDWVLYYLQSETGQNMMLKDVKAGSHQNLILDDIRKMKIPMPSIDEQNAIAEILSNMENEIEHLESKKAKFQSVKQGMMQELLTGKTRLA